MGPMRVPRALTQQPQQGASIDRNNPLTVGLVGAFNPAIRNARAVAGATIRTTRDGFGFSTVNSTDYWVASDSALISKSPTWTILTVLSGTSTNNPSGGVSFYAERPNDTQIVKLGMGDGQTNSAVLVVRDTAGNLMLQRGNADVRTDTGKPRVVIGTRRAANDHRIYVDGRFDASNTSSVAGSFADANSAIGNDPNDTRSYLAGASLPLVLVWNRALTDLEIGQVSANPWQVYSGRTMLDTARLVGLMSAVAPAASVVGSVAWLEQSDGGSISAAARVTVATALLETADKLIMDASAAAGLAVAWAESSDGIAVTALAQVSAAVALVESPDGAALVGLVGSAVAVNAAWAEQSDTASLAAQARVAGAATWAEPSDSAALAGTVGNAVVAAGSITESSDTLSMLATVRLSAVAGWAEASDTTGFSAAVLARAGLAWAESADALSAAASVAAPVGAPIDISKIHPSRIAVFGGSGSRVAVFDGSGSRVSRFT